MVTSLSRVSIGVPVFNEEARLEECIHDLRRQTYPDIEICISDNASTDATYDIALRLAKIYDNIVVVRQDRPIGAFPNFDAVRRMASGKFFMWLGADDRIMPTYIEKMVDELERYPEATVAHSACLRVDDHGDIVQKVQLAGRYNPNNVGPLRQAMVALTPFRSVRLYKYNLYVYGLFRKSFLDQIMDQPENILDKGDRVLPAVAALSGGLRYVDEFLFAKHVHMRSYQSRQPNDPLVVARERYSGLGQMIGWIFTAPTIPWWRRWYGIIIAAPYLFAKMDNGLRRVGLPPIAGTKFKF